MITSTRVFNSLLIDRKEERYCVLFSFLVLLLNKIVLYDCSKSS